MGQWRTPRRAYMLGCQGTLATWPLTMVQGEAGIRLAIVRHNLARIGDRHGRTVDLPGRRPCFVALDH
jgi:hypothetical protein